MDVSLFQRNNFNMNGNDDIKSLKNSMTLDFQSSGGRRRQPTVYSMNGANSNGNLIGPLWTPTAGPIQLESPDLKMCKLATPDIERFILSNTDNLATPTPSLAAPPVTMASDANGNYSQLKPAVTADMEEYARPFEDALQRLHNQDSNDVYSRPMSNSSSSSTNGSLSQVDTRLSATPNHLPSVVSPPVSPINMEDQERIKLERKRLRNRIAASKCRRRKLEKIARLEEKVKQLKETNNELSISVKKLREHVCTLKEEVMQHVRDGCQLSSTAHFH